jgi:imidazolonepropionase-like amidohydrolase
LTKNILLAAVAVLSVTAPASAATVVTADRMLDVQTGRYVDRPAILVGDDGRIQQVGNLASMQLPAGIKRVDLAGETLVPGLIDMHVHMNSLAEIGGYQALKYTDSFWAAIGAANAQKTLDAGFTTVRNVGSPDFDDVGLKEAIDGGWLEGPRIVPATYLLGATGGHCDDTDGLPPSYDRKMPGIISGPEDAREKVRWVHKHGAEVIKICATGGVFSLGDSVGAQQLTFEEMKAIADEAHMRTVMRESTTPSSPASTRSSMRASPATQRSSWRSSMAPGSTWISTTTIISSRPALRTAPSRRASTRSGWSDASNARRSSAPFAQA